MNNDIARIAALIDRIRREAEEAYGKATMGQKVEALKIASANVDRIFRFKGHKVTAAQALSWPRVGVTDKDGKPISGIPGAVRVATGFLAGAYIAGYRIGPKNRDHSRALAAFTLSVLGGLVDPDNPTQSPLH